MTPDEPDAPDEARAPDEAPPAPRPLIDDRDLSWVDKPEISEETKERRRLKREAHKAKVRRKRRVRRTAKVFAALLAVLLVLGGIWFVYTFGGLQRMPTVAGQAGLETQGTNILLVGSNPDEPDAIKPPGSGWTHDFAHSDMVAILHLTQDNRAMYVISIPGTSIVPIPGGAPGTLRTAYARGGAPLYVKSIETMTGIRMNRVITLDLNGLREITDDIGGVIVNVPTDACNTAVGPHRLDGEQVLDYISLQSCLPNGDLDRVQRQQSLLKALMIGAVDGGKVTNPFTLNKLLKATAGHLSVEKNFGYLHMFGMLLSMRHLRSSNTTFLTIPVAAHPNVTFDDTPAIKLDPAKDATLWAALRADQLSGYLTTSSDAAVLH